MLQRRLLLPALLLVPSALARPQAEVVRAERVSHVVPQPYSDPRATNLHLALETITVHEARADIEFIASDELAGRDSPSPGLRIAARFLRNRLIRLGWQPGASDGYFYSYSLEQYAPVEGSLFAVWSGPEGERRLTLGEDYFLSPMSRETRDETGRIVYVGAFEEEDIEGRDLRGAWCVTEPGVRLSRKRQSTAEELGVAGFLTPPDPEDEKSVAETHGRTLRWLTQPSMRAPRSYGRPVVYLTEDVATALLGEELPEVGEKLAGTFRESYGYEPTDDLMLENVCGLWPGSDPVLRNDVIIVSAHYDHVGERGDEIYNGADDNGSGTTGLLQIADALAAYGPMRRTVMLMWVSAEEKGLLGSRAWTKDPWLPEGMRPVCDLNIDMIGRNAPNEIGITPTQARDEYNRLTQLVEQNAAHEGFTKLNSADAYWSRSDHAMFSQNLGIPVAFLFSDVHEDYHKPTDTADKVDCDKLCRVARLVVRVLHELQTDELDL